MTKFFLGGGGGKNSYFSSKVPFLMSLPQMKNLGVSLDLRGTPEKILFHTGFLKGQGVPLHRNRAGHLTLDVNEICKKAKVSADKGRQLHAASSFPAVADVPSEIPSQDPPQSITACYTGVDQIKTSLRRGSCITSLSHATSVKMLPTGHTVYADTFFFTRRAMLSR